MIYRMQQNLLYFFIACVLQYNTPGNPADYVHRVGRTARIGLKGHALLFLTPAEVSFVHYSCNNEKAVL